MVEDGPTGEGVEDVFSLLAKPIRRAVQERGFPSPTEPQVKAVPAILRGENVLLIAPTGTGKTEAAFLPILHKLYTTQERPQGIKVLYITPLRALNRDLLERLEWWCKILDLRLAVRHGDTEVRERGRQALAPPDILITTPETLQAILPGQVMRRHLRSVRWVIVDEVHELAGEKRGSQLSLALERLKHITEAEFQRVGLSATIGTPERVASFLAGEGRPCQVIDVLVLRSIQLEALYPEAGERDVKLASQLYTYPEVAARLGVMKELVERHRSALIFTNTRSEAEVLASRFRLWDTAFPLGVHHGSLSKASRITMERGLKEGRLMGIVCTSSLELGIDIGLLELVIQYNSPRQVTRLLQRVGRSGHRVGGVAKGVVITQDSDDTLEAMVLARRALLGELEPAEIPEAPFDALTHQLAGLLLHKARWRLEEVLSLFRRASPYRSLSRDELERVLRYMHERYPRLAWFSPKDGVMGRPQRVEELYRYYFENLSMIPDEKQFLVVAEDGSPVGVLDEAFVAEHGEVGTKFVEAGTVWRIQQLYQDKIYVKREEDPIGAIPTWVGEEIPVPYEVAAEVGSIRRNAEDSFTRGEGIESVAEQLSKKYPVDVRAVSRALVEVREQVERGQPVPTDRRATLEQWGGYTVIHCAFGHIVNRTLSRILGYLLSEKVGAPVGVQQDPYRVILNTAEPTLEEVRDVLLGLAKQDLDALAVKSIVKTGLFRRRFLHVAKKFGAIEKDADLSSSRLSDLVEGLRDTVIFEEAVKTMLQRDADVERTRDVVKRMAAGELEACLVDGDLTPVARIGLEEITRSSDIIPPDRMKRILLNSTRARLLNEARTFVCASCWDHVESRRVVDLVHGNTCPRCGSTALGVADESEERVWRLCERVHIGKDAVPKRFRRLHQRVTKSAELLSKHGWVAAVALTGRGLTVSDAAKILSRESSLTDRFIEMVLEAERRNLRRRFFAQ